MLRTACADAARWSRAGQPVRVAVNLSPLQFADPALPQVVLGVLAETGLPAELLELEITEGALLENSAEAGAALHVLRDHGVRIALDDFGTGYSSLAYLTRLPLSHIKVDRFFVGGMLDGGQNDAVVRAVLAMAGSLGLRVTAEGVETLAQVQALQGLKCDGLQGFYFSRPVAADLMPALLAHRWTFGPASDAVHGEEEREERGGAGSDERRFVNIGQRRSQGEVVAEHAVWPPPL